VVVDTVKDVVIWDVGDKLVSTGGVAVRPFLWSRESLQVLGLAAGSTATETTAAARTTDPGQGTVDATTSTGRGAAGDASGGGDTGGHLAVLADSGLSGAWIALIAVIAIVALAAVIALAFLLGRARAGPGKIL
jgi:hypothetical protein